MAILKRLSRSGVSHQAVLLLFVSLSLPANKAWCQSAEEPGAKRYNVQEFDRGCGQPGHNCQRAFQFAFRTIAHGGGGTLQLPAGTFTIDFPGVAQNIPGGATIAPQSLLVVPPNTTIEGHLAADGTPDTVIEWRISSIPVFVFAKASHSGLRNLHMRFTGTMPKAFPFGDIALLNALGYHPTFPHFNQMSGSNEEMFSFAYVFDSDYCTFDHLLFDSATRDGDHIFNMAINMKGKGVVETNGGGLTKRGESNRITNIQVYDFMNAILVGGQNNLVIQNISADRRGSAPNLPPGHVIYTTGSSNFDSSGTTNLTLSTNTTIQNITEGPHTYNNVRSGGTLATKCLDGAQISNVNSQHPEGLIQTIYIDQNVTFSNLTWKSDYPLCTNLPTNCSTPVIYSTSSPPNSPPIKNLTFDNITLVSTASPITVMLLGDNLKVNDIHITTPPDFYPGQRATAAVLAVKQSDGVEIKRYVYEPVLDKYDPAKKCNVPFTGWHPSRNVSAEVTVKWPDHIPAPDAKAPILASGFQDKTPDASNSIRTSIVKR